MGSYRKYWLKGGTGLVWTGMRNRQSVSVSVGRRYAFVIATCMHYILCLSLYLFARWFVCLCACLSVHSLVRSFQLIVLRSCDTLQIKAVARRSALDKLFELDVLRDTIVISIYLTTNTVARQRCAEAKSPDLRCRWNNAKCPVLPTNRS